MSLKKDLPKGKNASIQSLMQNNARILSKWKTTAKFFL